MAASVVTTASIVAIAGESIAAPFAIPPTVAAPIVATASFGFVSVVMIARAASAPPSLDTCAHSFGMPASIGAIGIGIPIRPVEQTRTSAGASPRPAAVSAHMRRASAPARLTRRGVRVAGVEDDRGGAAVAEMRRAHLHRRGLREVRREHAGRRHGRAVLGHHDREIGRAGLLDPARQTRPLRIPRAATTLMPIHAWLLTGSRQQSDRPVVSGRPSTTLAAWIA